MSKNVPHDDTCSNSKSNTIQNDPPSIDTITAEATTTTTATTSIDRSTSDRNNTSNQYELSTILLLEHVNLNIPHPNHAIEFYIKVLGCQYDIRKIENLVFIDDDEDQSNSVPETITSTTSVTKKNKKYGTLWANCGRSQFHLPYDSIAQSISGKIGIQIRNFDSFIERLQQQQQQHRIVVEATTVTPEIQHVELDAGKDNPNTRNATTSSSSTIQSVQYGVDRYQQRYIEIIDQYSNTFYCRESIDTTKSSLASFTSQPHQPIVTCNSEILQQLYPEISKQIWMEKYGIIDPITYKNNQSENNDTTTTTTDCTGIDFIEFHCPMGTAKDIALFYESVFNVPHIRIVDQPVAESTDPKQTRQSVPTKQMTIIPIGQINIETGSYEQALIFREVDTIIPKYDGHHIAIYVGETIADYQQAYRNCELIDIIYINPRFSDKADTIEKATNTYQQFRIKDIRNIETGELIMELEHEIRSIQHSAWLSTNTI